MMPPAFCTACGSSVFGSDAFCPMCGAPRPADPPTVPVPAPTPPVRPGVAPAAEVGHRGGPGAPPPGRRTGWALAAVLAFVLVAGGAAGGTILLTDRSHHRAGTATAASAARPGGPVIPASSSSGSGSAPAASTTTATTVPAPLPGEAAAAAQIASILQDSASARSTVVAATQAVTGCTDDPDDASNQISGAVSQRQAGLDDLGDVSAGDLPDGESLIAELQSALMASDQADQDYESWMGDVDGDTCPYPTSSDGNFAAATTASGEATGDKQSFLALWNPIAARLGLTQYAEGQI